MNKESSEGVSPEDRPDWGFEKLLRQKGLMHYSTKLAMEGAFLQARDQLLEDIKRSFMESVRRGEKPNTAEGCEAWLRGIFEEQLEVFDKRLIEAGLPPTKG